MSATLLPSQYRKALPSPSIAFESAQGKSLFASSLVTGGTKSFFKLISQFTTQSEPSYCGLSSLVMVLNALCVDPRQRRWSDGIWRWYHEDMLSCCKPLDVVKKEGLTVREFACLARCNGLDTKAVLAGDDGDGAKFRVAIRRCLVETAQGSSSSAEVSPGGIEDDAVSSSSSLSSSSSSFSSDAFLVVSYSRRSLHQSGDGHFSPVAAYDSSSDCVLVLDTARFKYPPHWVSVSDLLQAMKEVDKSTARTRGFFVLERKAEGEEEDEWEDQQRPRPLSLPPASCSASCLSDPSSPLPPPCVSRRIDRRCDGLHTSVLLDWRSLTAGRKSLVSSFTSRLVSSMLNVFEILEHVKTAGGPFMYLMPLPSSAHQLPDAQRALALVSELKAMPISKFLAEDPLAALAAVDETTRDGGGLSGCCSDSKNAASKAPAKEEVPRTAADGDDGGGGGQRDVDGNTALALIVLACDVILRGKVEGWGGWAWQTEKEEADEMTDDLRAEVRSLADIFMAFYEEKRD